MVNKTLIMTATHGDEAFSIPVVEKLTQEFTFDWIIANPRALKLGKRFVESDLNRSGPGDKESIRYEKRRAYQLISKAQPYDTIIDIHGTVSNTGLFIILSDPNWQNIELAKRINLKNVVLWPSLQSKGPLTQFIPSSLEIECGPKDDPDVARKLETVLVDYFNNRIPEQRQNFYIVTGSLKGAISQPMKDFELTEFNGNRFYPLLVDQYPGIKCYMLQKLDTPLEF